MTAPVSDAADPNPVADLLAALLSLELGSEVSRDPASHAAYAVDQAQATRVVVRTAQAAPVLDGLFGKGALGHDSLYFRPSGDAPVHLARGVGSWQLSRAAKDYRERRLLRAAREDLEAVAVEAGGRTHALSKASESVIAAVLALRAEDFAPAGTPERETGLGAPYLRVVASGRGGAPAGAFSIGKPAAGTALRYARVDGRPALLLAAARDVEAILAALAGGR